MNGTGQTTTRPRMTLCSWCGDVATHKLVDGPVVDYGCVKHTKQYDYTYNVVTYLGEVSR